GVWRCVSYPRYTDAGHPGPEPTITWPYMPWADVANGLYKRRDATDTDWLVEGSMLFDNRTRRARFTSNGTFVVPEGVTTGWVEGCAGGGGGGGSAGYVANNQHNGGGGGAGQSVIAASYSVTPGDSLSVVIGAGGSRGAGGAGPGHAGG